MILIILAVIWPFIAFVGFSLLRAFTRFTTYEMWDISLWSDGSRLVFISFTMAVELLICWAVVWFVIP